MDHKINRAMSIVLALGLLLPITSVTSGQDRGDRGDRNERQDRGGRENQGRNKERGSERNDRSDRNDRGSDRKERISRESEQKRTEKDARPSRKDDAHVAFTRSIEGKRFENGIVLRRGAPIVDHRLDAYFPGRVHSYPHYVAARGSIDVVFSPFGFYIGVFPSYIAREHVFFRRPSHVYFEAAVYVGGYYRFDSYRPGYYLERRPIDDRWMADRELKNAVYDLEDAFKNEDITLLTSLTDPKLKIDVFQKGHYEYSVDSNDYLDMTRDFMRASRTTNFEVLRVKGRTSTAFQVFAKHTFKGEGDEIRSVYVCALLERIDGRWTLTQVDTSPEKL